MSEGAMEADAAGAGDAPNGGEALAGGEWFVVPFSRLAAWICLPILVVFLLPMAAAFIALGVGVLQAKPAAGTTATIGDRILLIVVAVVCFAAGLMGGVIVVWGVRLVIKVGIRGAPVMWANERGIHALVGLRGQLRAVSWMEVGNIGVYAGRKSELLIVEHADPAAWKRSRSWFMRLVWWNAFRGTAAAGRFPLIACGSGWGAMSLEEMEAKLLECWKRALGADQVEERPHSGQEALAGSPVRS